MAQIFCEQPRSETQPQAEYRTVEVVNSSLVAMVDASDFDRVCRYRWYKHPTGYIQACVKAGIGQPFKSLLLHRFVMFGLPATGPMVDHRNRNKLDCRRANLRVCDRTQNQGNMRRDPERKTSRYHGVCWDKQAKKWRSKCAGRRLGTFEIEHDAATAYDEAAAIHFGEFARLNFPLINEAPPGSL